MIRFLRVWIIIAVVYLTAAAFGPQGPARNGRWLEVNQHLVQVRNWLGEGTHAPSLELQPYPEQMSRGFPFWMDIAAVPPDSSERGGGAARGRQPHVGFPLGPAFLLLPLRIILRGWLATQWLGAVLGGLAVAALDAFLPRWVSLVDRDADTGSVDAGEAVSSAAGAPPRSAASARVAPSRNGFALLAGAGTLWLWLAPNGLVYHFAQTVATTGLTLALLLASRGSWAFAGISYAFAVTSRPVTVMALPFFLWLLLRRDARGSGDRSAEASGASGDYATVASRLALWRALAFATAPAALVLILLVLNQARFGSPLEFGYRYMQMAERARFAFDTRGQFNLAYFPENVRWLILAPPVLARDAAGAIRFPWIISHPMGMGIFFVTPAYLAALWTLAPRLLRRRPVQLAWAAVVLSAIPALCYFNTGLIQWGGRFLLDAWPFWLTLAAVGLSRLPRLWSWVLIVLSVLSNAWASLLTTAGWWPPG